MGAEPTWGMTRSLVFTEIKSSPLSGFHVCEGIGAGDAGFGLYRDLWLLGGVAVEGSDIVRTSRSARSDTRWPVTVMTRSSASVFTVFPRRTTAILSRMHFWILSLSKSSVGATP